MFGKKKREKRHYKAVKGSAVRAKYALHSSAIHTIEFTFLTENDEELIIEMDHENAALVIEQGIAAHSAIQRPIKIPRTLPFGG